jgi:hypothetical protein
LRNHVDVDIPRIAEIDEDPEEMIMEFVRINGMIVAKQASMLLRKGNRYRWEYWLKKLEHKGIFKSSKRLIRMDDEKESHLRTVWEINEPEERKGTAKGKARG